MTTRRYVLTLLAMLLPVLAINAKEPDKKESDMPSFTWGARIGFAASGTYVTNALIDGHKLTDYTQDTQVGNFGAFMFRFNSRRLLIQTGIGLNMNKSSFHFDTSDWAAEGTEAKEITCSYSMLSMTIPVQLGMHIINRPPYCMSVFTGPRLRYTPSKYYSVTYTGLDPYSFTDSPSELTAGWTAGMSIQIGRTFLDFEYEATINNISHKMYDTSGANPSPDYALSRKVSIISFSYGIMF